MSSYDQFLREKIKLASFKGFDVPMEQINPALKPHTRDIVQWAVQGGNRAIFASFGLHKTATQLEILRLIGQHRPGLRLQVLPLGVRQEFFREVSERFRGDAAIDLRFVRTDAEMDDERVIYLTNYESVREGKVSPGRCVATCLDEASVLRSYGSKTYQEFLPAFTPVEFKFVATATPSPNRYKELIHYAGYLGVMDTGQALTRFFQRDSEKAGNLTLYPHKEQEFWLWVASWAVFIQRPSDLGHDDAGYVLPALDVRYHEVPSDYGTAGAEKNGQGLLIPDVAMGLSAAAREKRDSLALRVAKLMEIVHAQIGSSRSPCLQQGLLPTEQGADAGGAEAADAAARNGGAGCACAVPGVVSCGQSGGPAGEAKGARPCQLPDQQVRLQDASTHADAQAVRADSGIRSGDSGVAGAPVPDLRALSRRDDGEVDRPLSCLGIGAGNPLPEVQYRAGAAGGERGEPGAGAGIPEHAAAGQLHQVVIWCDLNDEQDAIEAALTAAGLSFSSIYGSLTIEECEQRMADWRARRTFALVGKPVMLGQGVNLQQSNTAIFLGVTYKFNDLIQAVHRIQRFGQTRQCIAHIVHTEAEREVLRTLQKKWQQHDEVQAQMSALIRTYGLNQLAMQDTLARSIGVQRAVVKGDLFEVANNDCVLEAELQPENSVDLIVTSIPFANHYEYTPSYNDFGHTEDNAHFWKQMDFLTPQLLRILAPGRIYACHVKDRINFGNVTGAGVPTVSPFHAEALFHGIKHGFDYMGMITVVTDVVRENNQTYRLGYTEMRKDGTKMGVGSPEYILLFHKPQSDRSRGYADVPVKKTVDDYSLARWQVDAHAFWRSSGNRLLSADEMAAMGPAKLATYFTAESLRQVYDYERHVGIGQQLQDRGALPSTFMSLAPGSHDAGVWHDVLRMRTLNGEQSNRAVEKHVCLARGSLVLTGDGYKAIETVAVGDMVLTHKGRWRKVLVARSTGVRPVVALRAQGVAALVLTPEHKLWSRNGSAARSRAGAERSQPEWVRADETVGDYINLKVPPVEPSSLTQRECWIVGRWLADGHVGTRGDLHISVGREKVGHFEEMAGDHVGTRAEGSAVQYRLKGLRDFARDAIKACGRGAASKQVAPELLALDSAQSRALLDGYLSGDGHFLPERGRWMATSVSRALLLGIAMLAQRVHGAVASIHAGRAAGTAVIAGREVQTLQEWVLSFDIEDPARRKSQFLLPDGAWKKVRSVEAAGEAETWCLRVDEDESFTAEGCIVKNCPLQFDIVDRLIERYSNKGEKVYDPFHGLGTVGVRAIKLGRRAGGSELNPAYFADQVHYLQAAERDASMPSLFDLDEPVAEAA